MTNQFKFFEVHDPYYALIKAKDVNEAKELYITIVADDEEGTLDNEIKEVPSDYAIAHYSRSLSEDKEVVPLKEVLEVLRSNESNLLLIDGNLL